TLEQRLVELGFDPGTVDMSFDTSTRTAVVAFQRAANISADGLVGPVTWAHLDLGITAPEPDDTLEVGDSGPEVRAVQDRLLSLGYWLPDADGVYNNDTAHAVTALQKAAGLSRDGVLNPRTQTVLDQGYRPSTRSSSGTVLEIDLTRQILMVVVDGQIQTIYDTATGRIIGTTPSGTYTVTRHIDGYRYAPLGTLYRPKYFYGGVAIHGYTSVPPYPASHGCVRVTYPAMDHIWSTGVAPIGTTVMVYR
ncbi:MAG: murein L,D-transpeptidase, partial [Actinomycetia bacterium]|nr:murein L,D-transpeptidase [Actinomycetes bacterium]